MFVVELVLIVDLRGFLTGCFLCSIHLLLIDLKQFDSEKKKFTSLNRSYRFKIFYMTLIRCNNWYSQSTTIQLQ